MVILVVGVVYIRIGVVDLLMSLQFGCPTSLLSMYVCLCAEEASMYVSMCVAMGRAAQVQNYYIGCHKVRDITRKPMCSVSC